MSNDFPVEISQTQWRDIIAAVQGLGEHQPYWIRALTAAAPTFLAFVLGLASALFLDWLKTRRENRKVTREREERELSQLNVVSTAMAFNLENMQHLAMQQVLPHREQSHAALGALGQVTNGGQLKEFGETMSSNFQAMMTRCPEPYFVEVDLFKEIPFVLSRDPEILKLSGWMIGFTRELKNNIRDRNERIDKGGALDDVGGMTFPQLEEHIRVQAMIGNAEVIHALQLILQLLAICNKLRMMVESYKHIAGVHLKVVPPEPLQATVDALTHIAKEIVPDWPPPEPPPSPN